MEKLGAADIPMTALKREFKKHTKAEGYFSEEKKLAVYEEYMLFSHKVLKPEHRGALHRQGFDDSLINELTLGYEPRLKLRPDQEQRFRKLGLINDEGRFLAGQRITVPMYEDGKLVFCGFWDYQNKQGPDIPEWEYPNNWLPPLIGRDHIDPGKDIYLVNNYFAYLVMQSVGYPCVCCLGNGIEPEYKDLLQVCDRVFVVLDSATRDTSIQSMTSELYPKSRKVILPEGMDLIGIYLNDPLSFQKTMDLATNQAKTALQIVLDSLENSIRNNKSLSANDDVNRIRRDCILLMAKDPDIVSQSQTIQELAKRLKPYGVTKEVVRAAVRSEISHPVSTGSAEISERNKPKPVASFHGLVDLVSTESLVGNNPNGQAKEKSAFFLIDDAGYPQISALHEVEGNLICPPQLSNIPYLLPRATEVMKYYHHDNDALLFKDLLDYVTANSQMPDDRYYIMLVAWILHTYFLDKFRYSPILWFYAVFERGKSRTGKGLIYAAYRGIIVESLRDAYLIRAAQDLGVTVFFDVIEFSKKAEKAGSIDIIMARPESGLKVPRVNNPDRGPHQDITYYNVFGATIIATNENIGQGLGSRSIQINMPDSPKIFNHDITQESALTFKERLVASRARHLHTNLPAIDKQALKRLGDITRPLFQMVRLFAPQYEPGLLSLIKEFESDRANELGSTLEGEIVEALVELVAEGKVQTTTGQDCFALSDLKEIANADRPDRYSLTAKSLANHLKALGIKRFKRNPGKGNILYEFNQEQFVRLKKHYGLPEVTPQVYSSTTSRLPHSDIPEPGEHDDGSMPDSTDSDYPSTINIIPQKREGCELCEGPEHVSNLFEDVGFSDLDLLINKND